VDSPAPKKTPEDGKEEDKDLTMLTGLTELVHVVHLISDPPIEASS
jgi:hypothetical protein